MTHEVQLCGADTISEMGLHTLRFRGETVDPAQCGSVDSSRTGVESVSFTLTAAGIQLSAGSELIVKKRRRRMLLRHHFDLLPIQHTRDGEIYISIVKIERTHHRPL